jgi:HK97 family phage portal protein
MGIFNRKRTEIRADPGVVSYDDTLLTALLSNTGITKNVAMQIPTVASAIDLISGIVSSTPIKLYKLNGKKVEEVKDDPRVALLNDDTRDTLSNVDFYKAITKDYYLGKGGYAYIGRTNAKFTGLYYVDEAQVSIIKNTDPIFKDYDIMVNGLKYKPYEFIKILRKTKDGASGVGITTENSKLLEVAYESLNFESNLVKKGGNKKGFLKSEKRIDQLAMDALKAAFKNLYSNNSENVVVLNSGIDFKESSNTSVEMQLNENKTTNANEICKLFHVSPDVIAGKASDSDIAATAKLAAMPLFKTIECALNKDFLLEKEKKSYYFAFDTKELLKGNLKERMEAYGLAINNKIMSPNEARYAEDLESIKGLDIINMGLADVVFEINTGTYFTPNTKNITNTDKNSTTIPEVHTEKPIIDDLEKVETASDNIDESQIESEVK